ncbi:hypothetical protein DL96DRAFT_1822164 [Flagelloscypha sp. PMI_526]|nr:hypothetical protein DL96DRAFT_1822164 [Flagelloscypha sp. PMI_526]
MLQIATSRPLHIVDGLLSSAAVSTLYWLAVARRGTSWSPQSNASGLLTGLGSRKLEGFDFEAQSRRGRRVGSIHSLVECLLLPPSRHIRISESFPRLQSFITTTFDRSSGLIKTTFFYRGSLFRQVSIESSRLVHIADGLLPSSAASTYSWLALTRRGTSWSPQPNASGLLTGLGSRKLEGFDFEAQSRWEGCFVPFAPWLGVCCHHLPPTTSAFDYLYDSSRLVHFVDGLLPSAAASIHSWLAAAHRGTSRSALLRVEEVGWPHSLLGRASDVSAFSPQLSQWILLTTRPWSIGSDLSKRADVTFSFHRSLVDTSILVVNS